MPIVLRRLDLLLAELSPLLLLVASRDPRPGIKRRIIGHSAGMHAQIRIDPGSATVQAISAMEAHVLSEKASRLKNMDMRMKDATQPLQDNTISTCYS